MLRFLRVRNFALIDHLEIHFADGFCLLSGETGAGKSIIVDALSLLSGAKASSDMVRNGENRAIVEAVFECNLAPELDRLGLDADGEQIIIRREISSDERNRVYINNQPTTVTALRELAPLLLDIHGQHEQQTLLDSATQLALTDAFAGTLDKAEQVASLFADAQRIERELEELLADRARKVERLDLLTFQHDEILKVSPKPMETEEIRRRVDVLTHSGKLLESANRAYESLYDSESSMLRVLTQMMRFLREASQHDVRLQPIVEQMESVRISIQDIAHTLRDYSGQIDVNPQELERLQPRLAELERLHRKYGADLLDHLEKVRREMDSIGLTESKKDQLESELAVIRERYGVAAADLRRQRRAVTRKLESAVARELRSLAMPNASFKIEWQDTPAGRSGLDRCEFQVSANTGEQPMPLARIASGGELSRLMLALRTVLTADRSHKTLVFDEVDAGIGGKAAETVGMKLKELSAKYQILCVTHLAQIAAFADHQYRIEKHVIDGRTVTRVEAMTGEERVDELVRMMSGSRVTDAARQHIKELLAQRG